MINTYSLETTQAVQRQVLEVKVGLSARTSGILNAKVDKTKTDLEHLYDVHFNNLLKDEHTKLI